MGNITSRKDPKRGIVGVILIGVGIMFLLKIDLLWPLFILVPGLLLLFATLAGGSRTAPLAIPALLITGTGALLFVQNLTNYWQSWAYAWTLYGVFLGMGLGLMGRLTRNGGLIALGHGFVTVSLAAFAGFAVFFELIIGIGGGFSSGLWAVVLIGLGLWLLLRRGSSVRRIKAGDKYKKDKVFSGPVVYGSRLATPAYDTSRLRTPETKEEPVAPNNRLHPE